MWCAQVARLLRPSYSAISSSSSSWTCCSFHYHQPRWFATIDASSSGPDAVLERNRRIAEAVAAGSLAAAPETLQRERVLSPPPPPPPSPTLEDKLPLHIVQVAMPTPLDQEVVASRNLRPVETPLTGGAAARAQVPQPAQPSVAPLVEGPRSHFSDELRLNQSVEQRVAVTTSADGTAPPPPGDSSGRARRTGPAAPPPKRSLFPYVLLLGGAGAALYYYNENVAEPESRYDLTPVKESVSQAVDFVHNWFMKVFSDVAKPSSERLLPDLPENQEQKPTLVVTLEDFLVHTEWTREHGFRTKKRAGLDLFLHNMTQLYEVVIFTSGTWTSVGHIVDQLRQHVDVQVLYRDAALYKDGKYIKDLSHLNRDLSRVILIDTDEVAVSAQPDNATVVKPWTGQDDDRYLFELMPLLAELSMFPDVRILLSRWKGQDAVEKYKELIELSRKRMQEEEAARKQMEELKRLQEERMKEEVMRRKKSYWTR